MQGQGRGQGRRGGMGFGFRGTSPPAPFVGRGRGGLPRCWYYLRGMQFPGGMPGPDVNPQQYMPGAQNYPFSNEQTELDLLHQQATELGRQLRYIEERLKELGEK